MHEQTQSTVELQLDKCLTIFYVKPTGIKVAQLLILKSGAQCLQVVSFFCTSPPPLILEFAAES